MIFRVVGGFLVHFLTASGAVCGLLALHASASGEWSLAFIWLGLAAVIDGIDGPIARWIGVGETLPRFSGAHLDLVVDYLNYCIVPAFIVMRSGLAGEPGSVAVAAMIVLSSLFHFADTNSKTDDGFFVGFPAIWNVVVLYFFVFGASSTVILAVTTVCAAATFVPMKWVHPIRVTRWRPATLIAAASWTMAAGYEVLTDFPGIMSTQIILSITALYFIFVSLLRSFRRRGPLASS